LDFFLFLFLFLYLFRALGVVIDLLYFILVGRGDALARREEGVGAWDGD
jgi:hypothetical protein